ncbi:MAG: hypothetical protein U0X39_15485 [Bacteroidales bacterium]
MKKKVIFAAFLLLTAISFTSCESLFQNCKFCRSVTYENGQVTNEGPEAEYCGQDLLQKEAVPPIYSGPLVTKVECR